MFYEVIPTEVFRNGGGILTYSADFSLKTGQVVLVPLGKKQVLAIVYRQVKKVDFPTKNIIKVVLDTPVPEYLLKASLWLAKYYLAPIPTCANLILPTGLLNRGATKGFINQDSAKSAEDSDNQNPAKSPNLASKSVALAPIPLNQAQKNALESLLEGPTSTRLLRGVTGSGKTNIYLKLAENTLKAQKSVILLVPEIALTSQLVQIFTQTFGERVSLIHSNQTPVTRRKFWLQHLAAANAPRIIIGPRSALFTPVNNLGLIIVDEAHENAYYQENAPRYSAIRLSSFIASTLKIPCILGSATPNITDYHLAKTRGALVNLEQKAKDSAIQPNVQIVDLKNRQNFRKNRYFSDQLLAQITKNLQNHHQTLIFHNRRGSAPLTLCEKCGWQALCPNCYLPMALHTDTYELSCHICGHSEKVPLSCPECGQAGVIHKGFGTKLLESELSKLFPGAKIQRFDGDNKKGENLADLYEEVKSGQIDILIGTQTLARGLDLPLLTTIGIVQADAGLSLPDFSAEERTFALLTQVIGRVGRGHLDKAEVIVQTYQPDSQVIQTALQADFLSFAKFLLAKRHRQDLPPYTYLGQLSITYKTERTTIQKINTARQKISAEFPEIEISPAQPAFHEHTARGVTWQIVLKSTSREKLCQALMPFQQYHIELDPPSLL